jgi:hypothetical protein
MVKFAVKEVTYQISPADQLATTVPLPGLAIVFSVSWICWTEIVPAHVSGAWTVNAVVEFDVYSDPLYGRIPPDPDRGVALRILPPSPV